MDELIKQHLLTLLDAAKRHIEEGESVEAIEKIDAVISNIDDDEVATADETGGNSSTGGSSEGESEGEGDNDSLKDEDGKDKPKPKPLPGQGNNGPI